MSTLVLDDLLKAVKLRLSWPNSDQRKPFSLDGVGVGWGVDQSLFLFGGRTPGRMGWVPNKTTSLTTCIIQVL
jgi:hypothetical protein